MRTHDESGALVERNQYRADQVQTFLPSPMALATADVRHSGLNPLRPVRRGASEKVETIKGLRQRRLHKAFLRYHDAENWPLLREALKNMGRADLIGPGKHHLIPNWQPAGTGLRWRRRPAARAASMACRPSTKRRSEASLTFCRFVHFAQQHHLSGGSAHRRATGRNVLRSGGQTIFSPSGRSGSGCLNSTRRS